MRLIGPLAICLLLAGCPTGQRDPLVEVRSLHETGRFLESLPLLEELLDSGTHDPEVHYLYGVACSRAARASAGLWSLRRAAASEQFAVPASLELARAGIATRDFAAAVEGADAVLSRDPDHVVARLLRAEGHLGRFDYEPALQDADHLLELGVDAERAELVPAEAEISARLARLRALIGLGRLQEAETLFAALEEEDREYTLPLGARYCAARASSARSRVIRRGPLHSSSDA